MLTKIKINCTLKVLTGLHIGDNNGFAPIGALDNPVVRDSYSGDPMIPGSSLKGKMRTLLAKADMPEGKYTLPTCDRDSDRICRLFGTPGNKTKSENPVTAHLQFSDAFLLNRDEMLASGGVTEVKAENTITRSTSIANPRTMERVVRGAKFGLTWYYSPEKPEDITEDMNTLAEACRLLSLDYLGGSGTRGYGRVGFEDFHVELLYGQLPAGTDLSQLERLFEDVSNYAVQNI